VKNVSKLLSGLSHKVIAGPEDAPVSSIAFDSRKVSAGSLFVCIRGFVSDGHRFIMQAVKQGASVIMIQEDQNDISESELQEIAINHHVTIVSTDNTRIGLAHVSDAFFSHPSQALCLIGITGTKGKTTTSYMIREIFEKNGKSTGLIGTVSNIIAGDIRQAARTTPESYDLQAILHEMVEKKQDSCIMEVSSQGLMLDRVYGCHFRAGAFTNLYHDHIGLHEHANMEEYLQAKLLIFDMSDVGIVNADCSVANQVIEYALGKGPAITYGIDMPCDVRAYDIRKDRRNGMIGTTFLLQSPWYNTSFFIGMPGKFNIYNALCAISVAGTCGMSEEAVRNGLAEVRVPGRLQVVPHTGECTVLVDYAHNAASLENLLVTLREYCSGRLITVFGCGGDRAKSRRYEMGEVSGKLSDMTIITSDNPRSEDPMAIIADILTGFSKTDGVYQIEPDRTNAIALAISLAQKDDFVIIAGKGHENYQIFKDHTIHYDDAEIAENLLKNHAPKPGEKEMQ
jgi:UDP-N-acetylmuramoyl-L-alanyl-D-glutamate--2,6-diaminopimelate ligase